MHFTLSARSPSIRPWRRALAPLLLMMAAAGAASAQTPAPTPPLSPGVPGAPTEATPPVRPSQAMPAEIVDDCARASTTARCNSAASAPRPGQAKISSTAAARRPVPATDKPRAGEPDCQRQCRMGGTVAPECRPMCEEMSTTKPAPR